MAWIKSKFSGVRYREHPTRKHGAVPDRYYTIFYKLDGKMIQEALGWASESWEETDNRGHKKRVNWTEKRALATLAELKKNQSLGAGPRTLKEKREEQERIQATLKAEGFSVTDFWEQTYVHALKKRIQPSSWKKEVAHYELRIKPLLGNKALKSLTHGHIEQLANQMQRDALSPRTQQYTIGTVYRIWKHAARHNIVKAGDNPASGIKIEQVNNTRLRVISPKELKDILDYLAMNDPWAYKITIFCAYTGCRFSEAASLTTEFVHLSRESVLFPRTKNKDSREVFLSPELVTLLKNISTGLPGQYVFTKKDGTMFKDPPSAFVTIVEKLGLNTGRISRDRITFHSLRHTAATIAARRGVPIKDLQVLFGWKTPSMVFRYAKGSEDIQRQAMKGLANALSGEEGKIISVKENYKPEIA